MTVPDVELHVRRLLSLRQTNLQLGLVSLRVHPDHHTKVLRRVVHPDPETNIYDDFCQVVNNFQTKLSPI